MRVAKIFQVAKELKFSVGVGFFQGFQEEPLEKCAEDSDWQQKPPTAVDPTPAIGSKSAAGNNAVQVRMKVKILAPGVQDREKAHLHAQPFGMAGDGQQSLRGGAEEDIIHHGFVVEGDLGNAFGNCENDVEVFHGQ